METGLPGCQHHSFCLHRDMCHDVMNNAHQVGTRTVRLILTAVAAAAAAADNVQSRLFHCSGNHALQDGRHKATGLKCC